MASLVETRSAYQTLADLMAATRGIPPERIRLQPPPGSATEQDVIRVHDREGRLCELIDGILVEKTVGSYESLIAGFILTEINVYLRQHDLGIVLGADGMLQILPDQIRIPDAAFLSWDQFADRQVPDAAIWKLHPDLAVEVLSPSNSAAEIDCKIVEYFESGTQQVWVIDPRSKTAVVHHSSGQSHRIAHESALEGGDLLPGFSLPLATLFRIKPQSGLK